MSERERKKDREREEVSIDNYGETGDYVSDVDESGPLSLSMLSLSMLSLSSVTIT